MEKDKMKPKKLSLWKAFAIGTAGALKLASNAPAQEAKPVEKPFEPVKQESPINITSKTDYFSKYIYRGMNFSDKPVVQQNVLVNHKDLTFWIFGNYDTQTGKTNEEDLIIDYTKPIGKDLSLSLGYGLFTFPNTDFEKTQEVYAGLSLENKRLLNPSLTFVHDFKDGKGNYVEAGIGKDFNLGKIPIPLSTSAKLAYNDHYYRKNSGLSHLELGLGIPIKLSENTSLTPNINFSKTLDRRDFNNELYLGLSLEHKF